MAQEIFANSTQLDPRANLNLAPVHDFQKYQNGYEIQYSNEDVETMVEADARAKEILRTQNHIAIVTGDSGSVGRRLVEGIFKDHPGVPVVGINLGRQPQRLRDHMALADKYGALYGSVPVDLSKEHTVTEFLADPDYPLNGAQIDRLYFTAGRLHTGEMGKFTYRMLDRAIQEHAIAPILMAQHVSHQWKLASSHLPKDERPHKAMVMVSSVASEGGSPEEMPYIMGKRAAEGGFLCLARDLMGYASVNVVSPGAIPDSDMGGITLLTRPEVIGRIPGNPTNTRDIAKAILFAGEIPSLTGQTIRLNGGRTLGI